MKLFALTLTLLVGTAQAQSLGDGKQCDGWEFIQGQLIRPNGLPKRLRTIERYRGLPDDVVDEALCYVFGPNSTVPLKWVIEDLAYDDPELSSITRQIRRLKKSIDNFEAQLSCLAKAVYSGLTDAGKQTYCTLLQNMPDEYMTCGYEYLTDILTVENCGNSGNLQSGTAPITADLNDIRELADITRIIGGVAPQLGDFDSYVTVGDESDPDCGGAIIDSCTVVVAAHCVDRPDRITVNVGSPIIVQETIVHEGYNFGGGNPVNDIAVLKVNSAAFNNIEPANLATADLVLDGQDCMAVGVGKSPYGRQSEHRSERALAIYNGIDCAATRNDTQMSDETNQLCVGYDARHFCYLPPAGPLYCQQDGEMVLTGITSYGTECENEGYPGVYINVAHYADWITAKSGCQ